MSFASIAGPLDGVFVSDAKYCDLVAENGAKAIFMAPAEDLSIFSLNDGIVGYEYSCDLARVDLLFEGTAAVATAFCQEPGFVSPDLIAIESLEDRQIRVIQQSTNNMPAVQDGTMEQGWKFTRCAQIEELK